MSRQEFEQLPAGPPYYDYIQGEAIEVNRPTGEHQDLVLDIGASLKSFVLQRAMGRVWIEINVDLPTGDLVSPDVVYLSSEKQSAYKPELGYIVGTPDLVVEVLSPSTASYDRSDKLDAYRRAGVAWVWIADPATRTIEEYRWTPEGYLLVSVTPPAQAFQPKLFPEWQFRLGGEVGANVGDS